MGVHSLPWQLWVLFKSHLPGSLNKKVYPKPTLWTLVELMPFAFVELMPNYKKMSDSSSSKIYQDSSSRTQPMATLETLRDCIVCKKNEVLNFSLHGPWAEWEEIQSSFSAWRIMSDGSSWHPQMVEYENWFEVLNATVFHWSLQKFDTKWWKNEFQCDAKSCIFKGFLQERIMVSEWWTLWTLWWTLWTLLDTESRPSRQAEGAVLENSREDESSP